MKLSHEKQTHLSHVLVRALEDNAGVSLLKDRNSIRLMVVDMLRAEMRRDEEIEQRVRTKILTQKRQIPEGSQEWDILFRKYYEEELGKMRGARG